MYANPWVVLAIFSVTLMAVEVVAFVALRGSMPRRQLGWTMAAMAAAVVLSASLLWAIADPAAGLEYVDNDPLTVFVAALLAVELMGFVLLRRWFARGKLVLAMAGVAVVFTVASYVGLNWLNVHYPTDQRAMAAAHPVRSRA